MPSHRHGEKEEDANFSTLMIVIHHSFVRDQVSIVTGKEIPWVSAALTCTPVYATLSNITPTQSALMKITN